MSEDPPTNPVQTTRASGRLLWTLADRGPSTLAELEAAVDLTKGAVFNHLATLAEAGFVDKRGNQYAVSPRVLQLGEAARRAFPGMDVARESVHRLAEMTGEVAAVVVWTGTDAVVVETAVGELGVPGWFSLGERLPLASTAAGKMVLSTLPDDDFERLARETASSDDVAYEALIDEIRTVRTQDLAFDRGEYSSDRYSVAAPVLGGDDTLRCVLTVSGPKARLSGMALQQDIAGLVVNAASRVQKEIRS
jgi:DNA-binding IclR family transcriptional regulator